jgi:hypothetical protein
MKTMPLERRKRNGNAIFASLTNFLEERNKCNSSIKTLIQTYVWMMAKIKILNWYY